MEPRKGGVAWAAENEVRYYELECEKGVSHQFMMGAASSPYFLDHDCSAAILSIESALEGKEIPSGCAIIARWWQRAGVFGARARIFPAVEHPDDSVTIRFTYFLSESGTVVSLTREIPIYSSRAGALLFLRVLHATERLIPGLPR